MIISYPDVVKLHIKPLAFESLGTRSMCTFIETSDVNILIDPGVALAPMRFGLPPHEIELEAKENQWKDIINYAKKADVLVITHYHFDHFNPFQNIEIYKDKTLLTKHPTENINFSQKKRAHFFLEQIKKLPKHIEFSDDKTFYFGDTKLVFSKAVYHGTNPKLGYVTELLIDDGYRFVHTSDVEGPSIHEQFEFIYKANPNFIILDGPMLYMLGYRYSRENLHLSIKNIVKIIEDCPVTTLIIEHHALRTVKWRDMLEPVFQSASENNVKVLSAAEFIGKEDNLLEANRKELYRQ
ncbi:MAG: MBL fold metallo-hydrolase [Candidatus Odinarchaeia archaeon]